MCQPSRGQLPPESASVRRVGVGCEPSRAQWREGPALPRLGCRLAPTRAPETDDSRTENRRLALAEPDRHALPGPRAVGRALEPRRQCTDAAGEPEDSGDLRCVWPRPTDVYGRKSGRLTARRAARRAQVPQRRRREVRCQLPERAAAVEGLQRQPQDQLRVPRHPVRHAGPRWRGRRRRAGGGRRARPLPGRGFVAHRAQPRHEDRSVGNRAGERGGHPRRVATRFAGRGPFAIVRRRTVCHLMVRPTTLRGCTTRSSNADPS